MVPTFRGRDFDPGLSGGNCWKHTAIDAVDEYSGMRRLDFASRIYVGREQIGIVRYYSDFGMQPISNWWDGFGGASDQVYVVQTNERVVERCLLLASDPGDLVLDPTCGSGTTAYVAEQWGRRWITIDTSRVALALARARIMGARYPYYLLADSPEGQQKEAAITRKAPSELHQAGAVGRSAEPGLVVGYHEASWPYAAVSAPSASDERCDSRSPHRRRWRRMRCQLWPMRWDCRSVRQAMQPAMNRGLFCSSARRQRLRHSARRHTDGACDSPCYFVLCAAGRRGQRDRCCRSRCATASSACLGRRGPYPASPCASKSWCDRAHHCLASSERTTIAAIPRSA